jgi:hypothetical protein
MADDLTNTTFPSDDIDDMSEHRGDNPNAAQNLTDEDRSKGGKASSSQQDMSKLGQMGGNAAQQSGNAHKPTKEEKSKGGHKSHHNK